MKTDTETLETKKARFSTLERIGTKTGFITFLALIGYFFLMKALGLVHILELRFFNFVILAVGICYSIRKLKQELKGEDFYLKGWLEGIHTSTVAIVLFALFMSIYLVYFDRDLFEHIRKNSNVWQPMNGVSIFITLVTEAGASSVIITLAAMQYFKRNGVREDEVTE